MGGCLWLTLVRANRREEIAESRDADAWVWSTVYEQVPYAWMVSFRSLGKR